VIQENNPNILPDFPISIFPQWLQKFCNEMAENEQVPLDMVAMITLSCFSSALMKKAHIQINQSWKQDLNLYTLILAPSGSNKSGVVSKLRKPITDFEDAYNKANLVPLKSSQLKWDADDGKIKEIIKKLARTETTNQEAIKLKAQSSLIQQDHPAQRPTELRLLCEDATVEKISNLMHHNNGKISIIEPEGMGFFQKLQGQYSSGPSFDIILKSDEDASFRVDRMNSNREDFKIDNPRMTICIACQPTILTNLKSELHESGLFARFLISNNSHLFKPRVLRNDIVSNLYQDTYHRSMQCLLELKECITLTLSDEAFHSFNKLIFEPIQIEIYKGNLTYDHGKSFGGKLAGKLARIIAIVHILDTLGDFATNRMIPQEAVERCAPLLDYFISHKTAFHANSNETKEDRLCSDLMIKIVDYAKGQTRLDGSKFYQDKVRRRFKNVKEYKNQLINMQNRGLIFVHHYDNKKYEIEINTEWKEMI